MTNHWPYLRLRISKVRVRSLANGVLEIIPKWRDGAGVITRLGTAVRLEDMINARLKGPKRRNHGLKLSE